MLYTLIRAMPLRRLLFEATIDAPLVGTDRHPHRGDGADRVGTTGQTRDVRITVKTAGGSQTSTQFFRIIGT